MQEAKNIDEKQSAFIGPLIEWFEQQAADLPWRQTGNPYYVWLSEIMLQQTQVATVIPYYERFIEKFPTVQSLAEASQDNLLKQWEGLGYYSRARNLQAAARQVVDLYNGKVPQTADELQTLKGIGRYTAGAIASIAFGESVPVVDGNVIRVFSRIFDIDADVSLISTQKHLWHLATELMDYVPYNKSGDYNQSLMELGREVCKPRRPLCNKCPISRYCLAFERDVQEQRPIKKKKAPTPHYDVTCGLIWNNNGELLITKRPDDALLGGLWEFPGGKQEENESLETCIQRELAEELGIQVRVGEFFLKVNHAYTHFKITLHAFECYFLPEGGEPECLACSDFQWIKPSELKNFAFAKADRKIIEELIERPQKLF